MRTDPQAPRRRFDSSLRALQVLLSCLLLATGTGAVAARPAAPMVMVDARPGVAAEQAAPLRTTRAAARQGFQLPPSSSVAALRRTARGLGLKLRPTARRVPRRPIYLLRHALLR